MSEKYKRHQWEVRICGYKDCINTFDSWIDGEQKYCSYECYWKDMLGRVSLRKLPREIRFCNYCGNKFTCIVNSLQKYCSKICARKSSKGKHLKFKNSKDRGRKISKAKKGKSSWKKGLTKETDIRIRNCAEKQKGKLHHTFKTKKKIGVKNSKNMKKLWHDSNYVIMQMKSRNVKPNKTEKILDKLLQKLFPGEYKFVGDGQFILGGKCPDFINVKGEKQIIELFGDYWHGEKRTKRNKIEEEQKRINHFLKFGYRTLIIWEYEFNNIESLVEKLNVLKI